METQKPLFATQQLRGPASIWWANFSAIQPAEHQITWEELRSDENLLTPVFVDGKFLKETTMTEIRERVNKLV